MGLAYYGRSVADGYKSWYLNGKLHREDGPAREYGLMAIRNGALNGRGSN